MNLRTDFDVELIQATRYNQDHHNGLITFQLHLARDIWTELLTHRASARNASSRRAMSGDRIISTHGAWMPEVFHAPAKSGMGHGAPLAPEDQERARILWSAAIADLEAKILELGQFVCKTQANRLLTGAHITAGVVTMTEAGWSHFLSLRNTEQADPAMQQMAREIQKQIQAARWVTDRWHLPYYQHGREFSEASVLVACARIARVSYGSTDGRTIEDDVRLAKRLLKDKHLSPFEHICRMTDNPPVSPVTCLDGDIIDNRGWISYRKELERRQK